MSKGTFTKPGEEEKTLLEVEGQEVVSCGSSYTHCITASGSFRAAEGQPECLFYLTNCAFNVEAFNKCIWHFNLYFSNLHFHYLQSDL